MKGDPRLGQPICTHNLQFRHWNPQNDKGIGRSNSSIYPNAPFMEYLPTFPYQTGWHENLYCKKNKKTSPILSSTMIFKIPVSQFSHTSQVAPAKEHPLFVCFLCDYMTPGGKPFSKLPRLLAEANVRMIQRYSKPSWWMAHEFWIYKNVYPPLKLT